MDCSHDERHEGGQVKRQQLGQQKSEELCRKHIQTHIIYIYVYTNNPHLKIKQPLCRNPMINSDKNKTHLQPGKLGNQQR